MWFSWLTDICSQAFTYCTSQLLIYPIIHLKLQPDRDVPFKEITVYLIYIFNIDLARAYFSKMQFSIRVCIASVNIKLVY